MDKQKNELIKSYYRARKQSVENQNRRGYKLYELEWLMKNNLVSPKTVNSHDYYYVIEKNPNLFTGEPDQIEALDDHKIKFIKNHPEHLDLFDLTTIDSWKELQYMMYNVPQSIPKFTKEQLESIPIHGWMNIIESNERLFKPLFHKTFDISKFDENKLSDMIAGNINMIDDVMAQPTFINAIKNTPKYLNNLISYNKKFMYPLKDYLHYLTDEQKQTLHFQMHMDGELSGTGQHYDPYDYSEIDKMEIEQIEQRKYATDFKTLANIT